MMVVEPSVSNSGIPHGKFDRYKQVQDREVWARGQKVSQNDILPNNIQDLVENQTMLLEVNNLSKMEGI